jgi:hypothetical protein
MRKQICKWVESKYPAEQIPPWWANAARFALYPLEFVAWRIGKTYGYHWYSDTLVIRGVRYQMRRLIEAAHGIGAPSCKENAEKCTNAPAHVQKTAISKHDNLSPDIQTITLQYKNDQRI